MKATIVLTALALGVPALGCSHESAVSAPASPPPAATDIEAKSDPSHHLAVENEYVRALKVEVLPNAATLKHRHAHDYVTVTFGPAELSNEVDGKAPAPLKLQDGQVRASDGRGPPHLVRNVGATSFRNVTIELLRDGAAQLASAAKWDADHGVSTFEGGSREVLFVKDGVRVSRIELQPGASLTKPRLVGPYFVVAVSELNLRDDVEGKGPTTVHLQTGDLKWNDAGATHTLTNSGKQSAKIVVLEFK